MSYAARCLYCDAPMKCSERGRPRVYCGDRCRKAHKRHLPDAAEAEKRRVLLDQWGREFGPEVAAQLRGMITDYGAEAGRRAAAAIRLAVAEDRRWAELRQVAGTNTHGRQLAALLDRRDPRVVKFLEECGL